MPLSQENTGSNLIEFFKQICPNPWHLPLEQASPALQRALDCPDIFTQFIQNAKQFLRENEEHSQNLQEYIKKSAYFTSAQEFRAFAHEPLSHCLEVAENFARDPLWQILYVAEVLDAVYPATPDAETTTPVTEAAEDTPPSAEPEHSDEAPAPEAAAALASSPSSLQSCTVNSALAFLLENNPWIFAKIADYFSDDLVFLQPIQRSLQLLYYVLLLDPKDENGLLEILFRRNEFFFRQLQLFGYGHTELSEKMQAVLIRIQASYLSDQIRSTTLVQLISRDISRLLDEKDLNKPVSSLPGEALSLRNHSAIMHSPTLYVTASQLIALLLVITDIDDFQAETTSTPLHTNLTKIFTENEKILLRITADPIIADEVNSQEYRMLALELLLKCGADCFFAQFKHCKSSLLAESGLSVDFLLQVFNAAHAFLSTTTDAGMQEKWRALLYSHLEILTQFEFVSKMQCPVLDLQTITDSLQHEDHANSPICKFFSMLQQTGYLEKLLYDGGFLHALLAKEVNNVLNENPEKFIFLCDFLLKLDASMFTRFLHHRIPGLLETCRLRAWGSGPEIKERPLAALFEICLRVATPYSSNREPGLLQTIGQRICNHTDSNEYARYIECLLQVMVIAPRLKSDVDNFNAGLNIRALFFDCIFIQLQPCDDSRFRLALLGMDAKNLLPELCLNAKKSEADAPAPPPPLLLQTIIQHKSRDWTLTVINFLTYHLLNKEDPSVGWWRKTADGWALHQVKAQSLLAKIFTQVDEKGNTPLLCAVQKFVSLTNWQTVTPKPGSHLTAHSKFPTADDLAEAATVIALVYDALKQICRDVKMSFSDFMLGENKAQKNSLELLWDGAEALKARLVRMQWACVESYAPGFRRALEILLNLENPADATTNDPMRNELLLSLLRDGNRAAQVEQYLISENPDGLFKSIIPAFERAITGHKQCQTFQKILPRLTLKLLLARLQEYLDEKGNHHHKEKIEKLLLFSQQAIAQNKVSDLFLRLLFYTLNGGFVFSERPNPTGHLATLLKDFMRYYDLLPPHPNNREIVRQRKYYFTEILWMGTVGNAAQERDLLTEFFTFPDEQSARAQDLDLLGAYRANPALFAQRSNSFITGLARHIKLNTQVQTQLPLFCLTILYTELLQFIQPTMHFWSSAASREDRNFATSILSSLESCLLRTSLPEAFADKDPVQVARSVFNQVYNAITPTPTISSDLRRILSAYSVLLEGALPSTVFATRVNTEARRISGDGTQIGGFADDLQL